MRIQIRHGDTVIAEVNSQAAVAAFLGWSLRRVREHLDTGCPYNGITIEETGKTSRGYPVIAYTPTSSERFSSRSECAKIYGISRSKLETLIRTGGTAEDGVTTFDDPMD